MTGRPNPIVYYHPDGYGVARQDLKGRHSAGESFLTALLDHSAGDVFGLCGGKHAAEDFARTVQASHPKLTPKVISRADHAALSRQGLVYLPFPGLGREAGLRNHLGDDAYALCGVTHTISSRAVLDGVADLPVAPVQPWDALICTSRSVHDALTVVLTNAEERLRERLGASRFVRPMMPIIPLGVHAGRFAVSGEQRAAWRSRLGLGEDTTAILFFGRLSVHAKASPFPLALAAEQAAQQSKRRFDIIWFGRFIDDFQRRVFMETAQAMAPSVRFHHVDGRDPAAGFSIWSAADIFCSLSDNVQESFGLAVIEAMAAGLPVVVSNWDGYREAVKHGVNGVLIDSYLSPGPYRDDVYRYAAEIETYDQHIGALSQVAFADIGQTADWFVRLGADPALRQQLGAAAQRTIAEAFDWRAVMPRYFELWGEQIARLNHARASSETPGTPCQAPEPGEIFAGFASHRMTEQTTLSAGPLFAQWNELPGKPGIVIVGRALCSRTQYQALHRLFAGGKSRSIGETLPEFSVAEREVVTRTLHWAVKVGLLRLKSADSL